MFDHVTIGCRDREAGRRFYRTVLTALGREPRAGGGPEWGDLSLQQAGPDRPVTTRLHLGFAAPSREHVDAFWQAGIHAGYRDDGGPGPRAAYGPDYYGAFLLDPDGNSAEAVVHDNLRDGGIDHLWVRVHDRAASRRFYDAIAAAAGFSVAADLPDRTRYSRGPHSGSLTLVDGVPTTPFHLAFGVPGREAVDAFHRAALAAGARDNGAPGERPEYHARYYGAFALDPDGHNIECVCHG